MILLILASQIARIIGVNHQHSAVLMIFKVFNTTFYSYVGAIFNTLYFFPFYFCYSDTLFRAVDMCVCVYIYIYVKWYDTFLKVKSYFLYVTINFSHFQILVASCFAF
jgi:hypothetical protein